MKTYGENNNFTIQEMSQMKKKLKNGKNRDHSYLNPQVGEFKSGTLLAKPAFFQY